jgi:hypothetical protein
MLNLHVRPALAKLVDPVAAGLLRAGITPDVLTVTGTVGVVLGALVFFPKGMFFTGTAVVFFSVITDLHLRPDRRLGDLRRPGALVRRPRRRHHPAGRRPVLPRLRPGRVV